MESCRTPRGHRLKLLRTVDLNQTRLAVLELQEAWRRHRTPNLVMEEQWQRLQPLVLLNQVEQLHASGDISSAFSLLRQAMEHAPEDEALNAKLIELSLATQPQLDPSQVELNPDLEALDQELFQIEVLLDRLEEQAKGQPSNAS